MLTVKNISKSFKSNKVIDNISFDFENKTYGILGPNGAGRTTLIRCVTGVYDSNGEIQVNGKKADKCYTGKDFAIGYLPQRFGLFKELRLEEMMRYFATQRGIEKAKQPSEIDKVLELVNLSQERKKKVGALSGGMLRRAGIAQALLGDPPCIILDEPTAGLDPEECLRFRTLIAQIKKDKTIIISTHIVEDVEATCDNIIVMNSGKFVFNGTAKELCAVAEGKVYSIDKSDTGKVSGTFVIEKESLINGVANARILSEQEQSFEKAVPTVEDGYVCCIKNI